ncbi:MAG TPA: AGE family epimerase/isomerase, partial [Aggregatilineales bacterium]|nr:AGE family epimerase/isomerase [Aggregatilineales bacterium]
PSVHYPGGFSLQAAQGSDMPNPDLFIDVDWYRQQLIKTIDLWNGGLDGESGMGVYRDDFDGLFHVELSVDWQQKPMQFTTAVAQSRAIYINVEAYRAAGAQDGERFLQAINAGVDKLIEYFRDPDFGGYFWQVSPTGRIVDGHKHGYGNVHPLFSLAQAYSVTGNPDHLNAALLQLAIVEQYFLDRDYPGGIHGGMTRDFSAVVSGNSIDPFTHYFEALLILFDVTGGEQQAHVAELLEEAGNFLTQHLYRDQDGFTDRGYVAYNYDSEWNPSQVPYTRPGQWVDASHATTGHNIELAYLLSRAVERGFPQAWLEVSDKLIKFCLEYAMHPEYGGMIYDITDYAGQPIPENPDNAQFIWWPQAETARASLHFTVARDSD